MTAQARTRSAFTTTVITVTLGIVLCLSGCGDDQEKSAAEPKASSGVGAGTSTNAPDTDESTDTSTEESAQEASTIPALPDTVIPRATTSEEAAAGTYGDGSPVTWDELDAAYAAMRAACGPKPVEGLPPPIRALQTTITLFQDGDGPDIVEKVLILDFDDPSAITQITEGLNGCLTHSDTAFGATAIGPRVTILSYQRT